MDTAEHDGKFAWASFYEAFANALLTWRNRRDELVKGIHLIASGVGNDSNLLIVFYVQIMPDDFVMQLHR
ncbi:hypothetical protein, partial [Escherichia coli]|uniref:hypothetical protein n=1 Tax=Escherichia coli TaxID=562 RepID=UPI0012FFF4E6